MSREKQIEDLAKDLMGVINKKRGYASMRALAEGIYNAGCRKQHEGVWLNTGDEELDKIYSGYKCSVCGFVICGHSGNYCPDCGAHMNGYAGRGAR